MSDFLDVTKYLDKFPVRVATYQEALNDRIPFDKFYGKVSTRAIKKIFWYIQLQPFFISQSIPGRLLFQYNIIAPAPFYILNAVPPQGFSGPNGMQCVITVKWRVGTVVHRFCILNKQYKGPLRYYLNHVGKVSYIDTFPNYVNQVV